MQIRRLDFGDWADWITLAREVEEIYQGEMAENPEFHTFMRRKISQGEVFAAVDETGRCVRVITVSRKNSAISWFAVAKSCQGMGIGTKLLAAGLELLDRNRAISVTTFREGYLGGEPARALYQKFGFCDKEEVTHNGQPRSLMVREPKTVAVAK